MRRTTYLNVILTVNAGLLTALLWCVIAGRPILATEATAQSFTNPRARNPNFVVPTIPNASAQRYEMIAVLRDIQGSLDRTSSLMATGGIRVEVTNLDQIPNQ